MKAPTGRGEAASRGGAQLPAPAQRTEGIPGTNLGLPSRFGSACKAIALNYLHTSQESVPNPSLPPALTRNYRDVSGYI